MGGTRSCGLIKPIFNTDRPMANKSLLADRHSSNVLEFRADQMSPKNLGSQINIFMRYTRINKSNIPSMRRVCERESLDVESVMFLAFIFYIYWVDDDIWWIMINYKLFPCSFKKSLKKTHDNLFVKILMPKPVCLNKL